MGNIPRNLYDIVFFPFPTQVIFKKHLWISSFPVGKMGKIPSNLYDVFFSFPTQVIFKKYLWISFPLSPFFSVVSLWCGEVSLWIRLTSLLLEKFLGNQNLSPFPLSLVLYLFGVVKCLCELDLQAYVLFIFAKCELEKFLGNQNTIFWN